MSLISAVARLLGAGLLTTVTLFTPVAAQERLPWQQGEPYTPRGNGEVYRPPSPAPGYGGVAANAYGASGQRTSDEYRPPQQGGGAPRSGGYDSGDAYRAPGPGSGEVYRPPQSAPNDPYRGPSPSAEPYQRDYGRRPADRSWDEPADDTFSRNEIVDAGHQFFGTVSQGLASVIEYAFKSAGRPNGYILGEDAGGAIVAGLRYGEGVLHTKDAGRHKVYWQGPSIGYDFGAEGSKVMVLVYNLRDPGDIYQRFGGVQGSAYFIGGAGIQFQKAGDVTLAPIRSGLGLRLGANVGYLKYTRRPTWNPF